MKKTRISALLLLLAMLLSLAACGGGTASETEAPSAAATTQAPATIGAATVEPADEYKTVSYPLTTDDAELSIFFFGMPDVVTALEDTLNNASFRVAEEATGVHLVSQGAMPWAAAEIFSIMLAGEDYSDLVFQFSGLYSQGYDHAVEEGVIYDLKDYMEDYAPDYLRALSDYSDGIVSCTTTEGYMPEIGMVIKSGNRVSNGLFMRKDWLDTLGMEVPVTYDDFYDVMLACNNEFGSRGMLMLNTGVVQYNYLISGYGIAGYQVDGYLGENAFYQVDGEVRHGWVSNEFKDYLTMMNKWYGDGLLNSDTLTLAPNWVDRGYQSYINQGDVCLWYNEYNSISTLEAMNEDPNCVIIPVADAVMNEGDTLHLLTLPDTTGLGNSGCVVTTSCEYPEIAVAYLNWWFTEDGTLSSNYGEEDVTFTYVNGKPEYTELITESEAGIYTTWQMHCNNIMGTYNMNDKFDATYTETELSCNDVWSSNNDTAYIYSSLITMSADESSEYNSHMSEINTYASENIMKFVTGTLSLDEFDTFVDTIYDLGMERCIQIKQTAYDRYYAMV